MRRSIVTPIAAAAPITGVAACGGNDSAGSPGTTASTGSAVVDKYCELVKDARAAAKSGDAEKIKTVVPELQKSYPAAVEATKKDPTLAKRFAACAKDDK